MADLIPGSGPLWRRLAITSLAPASAGQTSAGASGAVARQEDDPGCSPCWSDAATADLADCIRLLGSLHLAWCCFLALEFLERARIQAAWPPFIEGLLGATSLLGALSLGLAGAIWRPAQWQRPGSPTCSTDAAALPRLNSLSAFLGLALLASPLGIGLAAWAQGAALTSPLQFGLMATQIAQTLVLVASVPLLPALGTCALSGLLMLWGSWVYLHHPDVSPAALLLAGLTFGLGLMLIRLRWRRTLAATAAQHELAQRVQQLTAQRDQARQADEHKSRFVAAACHDLRQPMHALGLFAATLQRQTQGNQVDPLLRKMIRAIGSLDRSFTDMLDIARLDADRVHPHPETFALRDLFHRLHTVFAGQAEGAGLSLRFAPGGKQVHADPLLLERVLNNLMQNALRYTDQGGIVVVARSRADRINIEVWDTGHGIPEAQLPRIFEEFVRLTPARGGRLESGDAVQGLGMGLPIVRRLLQLMGHALEVQSCPGRGTVFRIGIARCPGTATRADDSRLAPEPPPVAPLSLARPPSARAVLVIEDEPSIGEGLRLLLDSWGYAAAAASDITQARLLAEQLKDRLDLIVSDLHLGPCEDGLQAIDAVRDICGRSVPAMLLTGDTTPAAVQRVNATGTRLLFKPLEPGVLLHQVRSLLG